MHAPKHLLKLGGSSLCACLSVCMCRAVDAWVYGQHLLEAREIVSECHIKIT